MIRFIAQSWTVPAGLRPLEALGAGGALLSVWIDSMQVRTGAEQQENLEKTKPLDLQIAGTGAGQVLLIGVASWRAWAHKA